MFLRRLIVCYESDRRDSDSDIRLTVVRIKKEKKNIENIQSSRRRTVIFNVLFT